MIIAELNIDGFLDVLKNGARALFGMAGKAVPFLGPVIDVAISKVKSLLTSRHGQGISGRVAQAINVDHTQLNKYAEQGLDMMHTKA